jgi:hypothetical protein
MIEETAYQAPFIWVISWRTAVSFMLIAAVADRPNSTLTCDSDIEPDAGNAIAYPLNAIRFRLELQELGFR